MWGTRRLFVEEVEWEGDEGLEEIVELVFVAEVGEDLPADGVDGGLVEVAGLVEKRLRDGAAKGDGFGAALFGSGFIEVGVGVGN